MQKEVIKNVPNIAFVKMGKRKGEGLGGGDLQHHTSKPLLIYLVYSYRIHSLGDKGLDIG